jgi:hypothetical protein
MSDAVSDALSVVVVVVLGDVEPMTQSISQSSSGGRRHHFAFASVSSPLS